MRKTVTGRSMSPTKSSEADWLPLDRLARVEVTSEADGHPIEAALVPSPGSTGWRAAAAGEQVVRLLFDTSQTVRRVRLVFRETEAARTQEFVLRWSGDNGRSYRDVVRQQFNFSPAGSTREEEDYAVDLAGVTTIELAVVPDISRGPAHASLGEFRLA